jgi:hypothetical protein
MTDKRMIELLAGFDGYEPTGIKNFPWMRLSDGTKHNIPWNMDYLNSHDAMQRLIDGLDISELNAFTNEIVGDSGWMQCQRMLATRTARQKAEAYLKAKGVWE